MTNELAASGLILGSALLHAGWNTFLKQSGDRWAVGALINLAGSLVALPFVFLLPLPDAATWGWLALSTCIHLVYQWSLVQAYEHGDMSVVYPIARGLGPLVVGILAGPLLGDWLPPYGYVGVAIVTLGIWSMALGRGKGAPVSGIVYAVVTGLAIGSYTLVDAGAVRSSANMWTFIVWMGLTFGPAFLILARLSKGPALWRGLSQNYRSGLAAGIFAWGGYALALTAYSMGSLGRLAALREISIVFVTILAVLVLHEKVTRTRAVAALLIAVGAIVVHV